MHCTTLYGTTLTECGPLFGLPTKSGRCAETLVISGALPCADTPFESNTVNGAPLISETIPLKLPSDLEPLFPG